MSVLAKAAQVVEVLLNAAGPTKLGVIADQVALPKSSAHRLLAELVNLGMVRRLEDGQYTVGYRLVRWGHAAERLVGIRTVAEPVMRELCCQVNESVYLHVLEGSHRVCIAAVDGPHTLRPVIRLGQIMSLGLGASGKLLLAYADEEVRKDAWAQATEQVRTYWPDDARLRQIRGQGWATSVAEMESGLTAVAAAVPTRDGSALGALTVAGSTARLPEDRCTALLPLLLTAAHEIAGAVAA